MAIKVLDELGQKIFEQRYAYPGETSYQERCKAIAKHVAKAENEADIEKYEGIFYRSLSPGDFVPGGRIIFGSGRNRQNLLNCYVVVPEDTVESIGKTISDMYKISCGGGGVGFNFSQIRPRGDDIQNIKNSAPGAVSVMKMINEIGNHVKAGKNRRCLAKGTKVLTEFGGYKNIEDVTCEDKVLTLKGWKPVTESISQGKQKIVRVHHQDGFLDCTINHRIAVLTNIKGSYIWKKASELLEGDRLIFIRDESKSIETYLPKYEKYIKPEHSTTCKDIVIPELDEGIAWLLGVVAGDGHVRVGNNSGGVFIACHSDDVSQIEQIVTQLSRFGIKSIPYKKEGENCVVVKAHSKQLAEYFYKNFKKPNESLAVPNCIKYSTTKIKLAYVAGVLDSDGCAISRPISIMATVYLDFAKEIQSLLYSCGIESRLRLGEYYESRQGWKLLHRLNLISNSSKVRFRLNTEDIRIKEIKEYNKSMYSNSFPVEFVKNAGLKEYRGKWDGKSDLNLDTYEKLYGETTVVPITFKYVEDLDIEEETYDLSVEDEHCFIADGVLVHNTALMAELNVTHPDILEFLHVKLDLGQLNNFNISVAITDRFIEACENDEEWYFVYNNRKYYIYSMDKVSPKGERETINVVGLNEEDAVNRALSHYLVHPDDKFENALKYDLKAKELWSRIWTNSVNSGDPGIFNIDLANRHTNVSYFEYMPATNPCGEITLPSYGNCCLGHINLSNMVIDNEVDWRRLAQTIRMGVRFLDNVLTINHYPIPECKDVGQRSRRIGLGVMGLHHMLIKLGIKYGSEKCLEFLDRLFATIRDEAYKASMYIAREKGSFPMFNYKKFLQEEFAKTLPARIRMLIKENGIRNAVILTCAPTGTISMVHGASSGIEPIFAAMYFRRYREANTWRETVVLDPMFKEYLEEGRPLHSFVGAYDVTPEEHIKVQATIQKYIDNAISKTINLPETAKAEDFADVALAYAPYLKGLTVYKAGSHGEEPLKAIPLTPKNIEKYAKPNLESKVTEGDAIMCKIGGECGA